MIEKIIDKVWLEQQGWKYMTNYNIYEIWKKEKERLLLEPAQDKYKVVITYRV